MSGSAFIEDDPELAALGEDLKWPLELDATGDLAVVRGLDCLEADIIHRASAFRGELAHRPEYGIDFEEFEGGPLVDEENMLIEARCLEQYQREDRLDAVVVDVVNDPHVDGDRVIRVTGTVKTGDTIGPVEVPLTRAA